MDYKKLRKIVKLQLGGSLGKFAVDLGKQELSALGGQMGEIGVSSME